MVLGKRLAVMQASFFKRKCNFSLTNEDLSEFVVDKDREHAYN